MAKLKIFVSQKDGEIIYRDSENHQGPSIDSSAKPGTKIIWALDKNSGLKEITGLNLISGGKLIKKGPLRKSDTKWVAVIGRKTKGDVKYEIFANTAKSKTKKKSAVSLKSGDGDDPPPRIIIRV